MRNLYKALIILIALASMSQSALAQVTVTIGTETNVSGSTTQTEITPFGSYYTDGQNQILFTASELSTAGLAAGDLTEIGWNVVISDPIILHDFNIEVKHTTVTTVTDFETTGFTNVYAADYTAVTGWNMFAFTTPFTWDGTSNVLIKVCFDNVDYSENSIVFYSVLTDYMNGWAQNDVSNGCTDPWEGSVLERPNTRFTGEENTNPLPDYPFDESPINGTTEVAVNGDLTWEFGNNSDTYDLWLGAAGAMELVVENGDATNPNGSFTYSLENSTLYQWQLIVYNSNGQTDGTVWNFATECTVSSTPYFEEFSYWPPVCWDMTGGDFEWEQYSDGIVECAVLESWDQGPGMEDHMTTGFIDISGGEFAIEFLYSYLHLPGLDNGLEVLVTDDDGVSWTQVWSKYGEDLDSNDGATFTEPGSFVLSETISVASFESPIKILFKGISAGSANVFVDDLSISGTLFGSLEGTITDLASGSPIEGAIVNFDQYSAISGSDGTYAVTDVVVDDYIVTCSATGYNEESASVTINPGATSTQDFAITSPTMDINPLSISVAMNPDEQLTENVAINNNGNGSLYWNAFWESTDVTTAYGFQQTGATEGLAISFETNAPGTITTINTVSGAIYAGDFDNVNTSFYYVINDISELYTVDVVTGEYTFIANVSGFSAGHSAAGMACDKSNGTMYVSSLSSDKAEIYTIDLTTGVLTLIGSTELPGLIEIVVDETGTMYGWDVISDSSFIIDVNTGESTLLGSLGVDLGYAQGGSWDPVSNKIYASAFTADYVGQLMTLNRSTGAFEFVGELGNGNQIEIDALCFPGNSSWLNLNSNAGTIDPTNSETMFVNFDSTNIPAGTVKEANIYYFSNPDVGSITVPVTLNVEGLSVEDHLYSSIQLYPNPASGHVAINSSYDINSLKIYSLTGQVIIEQSINNKMYQVDTSNFNSGTYFFQIVTNEGTVTKRLIIM